MSRREPGAALRQMLDHAREAVEIAAGRQRSDLDSDRLLNLALTRLIEIVGEAATRVPEAERRLMPAIMWKQLTGMRNRLIHGYDVIDFDLVWAVVQNDLPPLIADLENLLK